MLVSLAFGAVGVGVRECNFAYRKARLSLPIREPGTHRDNMHTHVLFFEVVSTAS